jgi:hypothetical protein
MYIELNIMCNHIPVGFLVIYINIVAYRTIPGLTDSPYATTKL